MTNEMHNSYNQFLFRSFLSASHVSNESSRSSSGAQHNILYYTVWYNRYNILCSAPDDERVNSFETYRARKNCGIKIIYKNCASPCSSTHYTIAEVFIFREDLLSPASFIFALPFSVTVVSF